MINGVEAAQRSVGNCTVGYPITAYTSRCPKQLNTQRGHHARRLVVLQHELARHHRRRARVRQARLRVLKAADTAVCNHRDAERVDGGAHVARARVAGREPLDEPVRDARGRTSRRFWWRRRRRCINICGRRGALLWRRVLPLRVVGDLYT